jgi:hypothetical protein
MCFVWSRLGRLGLRCSVHRRDDQRRVDTGGGQAAFPPRVGLIVIWGRLGPLIDPFGLGVDDEVHTRWRYGRDHNCSADAANEEEGR